MKNPEILQGARKYIKNGSTEYVCIAVRYVANSNSPYLDRIAASEIIQTIEQLIYPRTTVSAWLAKTLGWTSDNWPSDKKLRQYRLRWIDHMIAEYKAKGD